MRGILTTLLLLAGFTCLQAQSFEEYKKQKEAAYSAYKSQKESDYEAYKARVNKEFADYMRRYWEWLEAHKPVEDPYYKLKKVGPLTLPDLTDFEIEEDNELENVKILPIKIEDSKPITVVPMQYKPKPAEKKVQFRFYGTPCEVRFDLSKKTKLANAREDSVADMWMILSTDDYNNILYDLLQIRKKLQLCDWAYMKLTESAAEAVFGENSNESVVLSAFLMTQSGYKIRMGRSDDEKLHLMFAPEGGIYRSSYWEKNGAHYYLSKGNNNVKSLYIFDKEFPNEKTLSMAIDKEQLFLKSETKPRTLRSKKDADLSCYATFNDNSLKFYTDYPRAYPRNNPNNQYIFYAMTPISKDVQNMLYPYLKREIAGKTEEEAANVIINFVQTAFVYGYDDELWGSHRAFFPEETLFYPYSDCEDRAILFCRLIKDLMGLDAVVLECPGHAMAAVRFNQDIKGTYLMIGDKKYIVCEPTYNNPVPVGVVDSRFNKAEVKVAVLTK